MTDTPHIRLHLVDGSTVDGDTQAGGEALADHADTIETFKEFLKDLGSTGPDKGWQLNMNMPGGGWAVFPRSSVLWIEFVSFGADDD